jgi:arylamine N-acetyltransferase
VTNLNQVATKILDRHRGGFCLEVNGLLAELLTQLGYIVCRVPAYVYVNNEGFRDLQSHIILIVTCPNDQTLWMMDVGFGEPSIHPLQYDTFDEVQITPDGMRSKICKVNDGTEDVVLFWWNASMNNWVPRLKWNYTASMLNSNGPPLSAFIHLLDVTLVETSIFAQKLICCRLTRDQKFTLAGNKYKVTGPPRFIVNTFDPTSGTADTAGSQTDLNVQVPVVILEIASDEELRSILFENFGIPVDATEGITLNKSKSADPKIWSQL